MNLFKDFECINAKAWKQKIQMDLKGADYNKTLITSSDSGINIKPFYHKDTFKITKTRTKNTSFKICQTIVVVTEKIANKIARKAFKNGVDKIEFIANKPFEVTLLFNKITTNELKNINVKLNFLDLNLCKKLAVKKISYEIDIIENFVKTGNWFINKETDFDTIKSLKSSNLTIGFSAISFQNAGANIVQQIAYLLGSIAEVLNLNLIKNEQIININFAIGSHYFFEIAKIRAFRILFNKLTKNFNVKPKLNIIVKPTLRNKTIYDYNLNMLRTTTECMSAIIGGADWVTNVPYDQVFNKSNAFGERIARNQLIILKEESYFKEANNIANGSYYIEDITHEIANKSLELLKEIEKNNGLISQLLKGTIQRKIEETAKKEQANFDAKKIILVGTNNYLNLADKMADNLEIYPFLKQKPRKTLIQPIIAKRLAEKFEKQRLTEEKNK